MQQSMNLAHLSQSLSSYLRQILTRVLDNLTLFSTLNVKVLNSLQKIGKKEIVFLNNEREEHTMASTTQTKVKIRPLGNRVLARRLEQEEKLKGGIILPDSAKKKQESAEVIAVGNGKKDKNGKLIPMPVAVGDIIMMDKYSGQEVKIDDEEYLIVRSDDIIAVVQK
jgi:chaperonin GroES